MSIRLAVDADAERIDAFLRQHLQTSMFPLVNLRAHGLQSSAPRGMRVWVVDGVEGIDGVFAVSNEGMIMPQLPVLTETVLEAVAAALAGTSLMGAVGAPQQVRAILKKVGLSTASSKVDGDEPGYALDLDQLRVPPCEGFELSGITDGLMGTAAGWRGAYNVEVLGGNPADAKTGGARDVARFRDADSHRILLRSGAPVAMTGFNAALPDVVQIGGVFTPQELRGQGYARRAVALHLQEARALGVERAVLFAASQEAARVYESIGFQAAGAVTMVLFQDRQEAAS